MARRSESVAQRQARERLRERHELEVRAVTEFFGIEDRIDALRGQITMLEDEQANCVTRLVEATDVSRLRQLSAGRSLGLVTSRAGLVAISQQPSTPQLRYQRHECSVGIELRGGRSGLASP